METLSGKGEGWGKRYWKEDYLLKSGWEWHTTAIWHLKIIEIILHLLHQLQNWPCSALSYKDSTYIMQLEFWFIPWLFRAWTIAIMFVPSYSFFFCSHTLQGHSELPCLLCFSLQYPCCSHPFFPILILLCMFNYIWNQYWKFNVLLQSFKNLKADSNLLCILQSICWACITAATQILHLSFVCLKYSHFTCFYVWRAWNIL